MNKDQAIQILAEIAQAFINGQPPSLRGAIGAHVQAALDALAKPQPEAKEPGR